MMPTRLLAHTLVSCWLLCAAQLFAQPSHRLHPLADGLALSAGLGMTLAGYHLNQQLLPLPPANLQGLNTADLPRIDRFATAFYRPSVASLSDWLAVASVAVPAVVVRIFGSTVQIVSVSNVFSAFDKKAVVHRF